MKAFVIGVLVTLLVVFGGAAAVVYGGLFPVAAERPDAPAVAGLLHAAYERAVARAAYAAGDGHGHRPMAGSMADEGAQAGHHDDGPHAGGHHPEGAMSMRPDHAGEALFAALSQGDADAVTKLLDPQVLVFESGGVEASAEEYVAHHLPADMAFAAGMQATPLSQRVFEMGDYALVANYTRLHGEYQGEPMQRLSTETLLLQRQDEGWRIAHIHWSSRAEQ